MQCPPPSGKQLTEAATTFLSSEISKFSAARSSFKTHSLEVGS